MPETKEENPAPAPRRTHMQTALARIGRMLLVHTACVVLAVLAEYIWEESGWAPRTFPRLLEPVITVWIVMMAVTTFSNAVALLLCGALGGPLPYIWTGPAFATVLFIVEHFVPVGMVLAMGLAVEEPKTIGYVAAFRLGLLFVLFAVTLWVGVYNLVKIFVAGRRARLFEALANSTEKKQE